MQSSLVAGKNAGNFADSVVFCENASRKHLRIQPFADEFPTQASRESIRASREFIPLFRPEQGIWREIDSCALTSKGFSFEDKTISNCLAALLQPTNALGTGRAGCMQMNRGRIQTRINGGDRNRRAALASRRFGAPFQNESSPTDPMEFERAFNFNAVVKNTGWD